ncbi:MAG: DoxX family protein [Chitinophagaceae bacterium]|nr:MAG: DoxX family protein [Chitinophagaceae bacterium]
MNSKNVLLWICRIVAAAILLQTVYFKFTASPESVYIFTQVDMEPYGRYAIGITELIAAILILIPKTSFFGALLAFILMIGALATHVMILGLEVNGDHGLLAIYAVVTSIASAYVIIRTTKKKRKAPF